MAGEAEVKQLIATGIVNQRNLVIVADDELHGEDDIAYAGLIALANVLEYSVGSEAKILRSRYAAHTAEIAAKRQSMVARGMPDNVIAKTVSDMRLNGALEIREAGSAFAKAFAESYDKVRGNKGRPTYEKLRAKGKTDQQIMKTATKTDEFANNLPKNCRLVAGGLWILSAGLSIKLVIDAPPEYRTDVIEAELSSTLGAAAGGMAATGLLTVVGVATGGLGAIAFIIVGSILGGVAGQQMQLSRILDIGPRRVAKLAGHVHCLEGAWQEKSLVVVTWSEKKLTRGEGLLVISTGEQSERLVSARGGWRMQKCYAITPSSIALFKEEGWNTNKPHWIPEYLLKTAVMQDFLNGLNK